MAEFTKGQWLSSAKINSADDAVITSTVNGEKLTIAEVYSHSNVYDDAALIAAAPDLYEELLDRYESEKCGCNHPACKSCKRDQETLLVLKKARGEK